MRIYSALGLLSTLFIAPKSKLRLSTQKIHNIAMSSMIEKDTLATDAQMHRLLQQTNAWCGLNGLMYTDGKLNWTPAPLSLVPNVFNATSFQYAADIQPVISKLVDAISRDKEFLLNQLSSVSESDEFTKKVMDLYKEVPEDVIKNGLQCGILRSDYMINNDHRPLQVEINTIASSFGYLSKKVSEYHRFVLDRNKGRPELQAIIDATSVAPTADILNKYSAENVVSNPSSTELAAVLAAAHKAHGDKKAVILFIVQPGERNVADQRAFEAELWSAHGVATEFLTLAEIRQRCSVQAGSTGPNTLFIHASAESKSTELGIPVSVAYYRAGYTPRDYPTEAEWEARRLIEHSNAVKCPNAGYQLTGTKAIQACLCLPGVLERFLTAEEAQQLRACFAFQYSLVVLTDDSPESAVHREATLRAVQQAQEDGAPWVLKPQREGGGNNLYGAELSSFLKEHQGSSVLSGYVLMQRIFPLPQKTAFLRTGAVQVLPSISELGVYGTYLAYGNTAAATSSTDSSDSSVLVNAYGGYLLRTKPDGVDEGGVATGYSVLNSIILD